MADKDKAGPSTATDSLVDFASLPSSALDSYIAYYELARGYPPPPSKRSPSPEADSAAANGDEDAMDEEGNSLTSRRGSRQSVRNTDDRHATSTSSRLRPRSPSSSVAHMFPGNARRLGAGGTAEENGGGGDATAAGDKQDAEEPCPSHFFDVQEADEYLASTASKHFAAQPQPKEGEVVVQFLYRCRAGDKSLKVAS